MLKSPNAFNISIFNSFVGEKNSPKRFVSTGAWSNAFLLALVLYDKSVTNDADSNLILLEYVNPIDGTLAVTVLSYGVYWYG